MLLQEYYELKKFKVLNESEEAGEKKYVLRGVFSKVDSANRNKRIYPKSIMESAIDSIREDMENGGFVGELDHPPSPKINVDKISHKITKLEIAENGDVIGEIVPAGPKKQDLISLIEDGIRIGVSTRATGGVRPYNGPLGEGLVEVQQGLKLRAIDVVHTPSCQTAMPQIFTEGYDYDADDNMFESEEILDLDSIFKESLR